MFVKKILILKSDSGKNTGVLRLTANDDTVEGALTLNFAVTNPLSLVLNVNNSHHEVKVPENGCKFKVQDKFSGEAACMLIENETPILYGSTNNDLKKLSELKNAYYDEKNKQKKRTDDMDMPIVDNRYSEDNDFEKIPEREEKIEDIKCDSTPISKKPATGQKSNVQRTIKAQSEPSVVINEGITYDGENFYIAVKPQLDEMFECYPREAVLNELIASSSWVRVDCDGEYYVVGLIMDEGEKPQYICYGIPGSYQVKPPEEIADVCEWFPLDIHNKFGDGYWLIYQDAKTGKCLKNSD